MLHLDQAFSVCLCLSIEYIDHVLSLVLWWYELMASYKSYSKRTPRVSRNTTASDLFEDLISSNSQKETISATGSRSSPTKASSTPHEPRECSPPLAKAVKATSEKTVSSSSWSRRRYEYSFSPR